MSRILPHSTDAEKAVLGALMQFPGSMRDAMDQGLMAQDFFNENHMRIFDAMLELNNSNSVVDIRTVTTKLDDKRLLSMIGGPEYLFDLTEHAVSSSSVKYHIGIVQDKAHQRRLYNAALKIVEESADPEANLDDLLSDAEKGVLEVTRNRKTSDFRDGAEVADSVYNHIRELSTLGTSITGLETGYHRFDAMTNGLHKGDLIILAARPAVGKTAFALNLGLQCSKRNNATVAIFSLEMPAEQLMTRMLASESRVNNNVLKTGELSDDDWSKLNAGTNTLKACPIYIDDSSTIKVNEIFAKCRKLKNDHGLDLVIIDYLQLISGRGRPSDNRQVEVSEISRSLKQLARDIECPVIALSQLSRSVEQRQDKTPMLSDLRESGSIEQDADIVMFLDRDDYYNHGKDNSEANADGKSNDAPNNNDFSIVRVILAKHRNGAIGELKLAMTKSLSRFDNLDWE